ncbi:MAG: response regulator [Planctomycetota bacterium]
MPFEKDVLTTGEVAKICNVAPRTVSKWFDNGQIAGYRIPGSKDRRIPVAELIRFMKSHGIPLDGITGGGTRVLIVDGDQEVSSALNGALQEATNYEVRSAQSAFEAGIECERFRPHVLLLDMHLEGGDSERVAQLISGSEQFDITKLVGMSSRMTDSQIQSLLHSGFESFLKKPFAVRQVVESIEKATRLVY